MYISKRMQLEMRTQIFTRWSRIDRDGRGSYVINVRCVQGGRVQHDADRTQRVYEHKPYSNDAGYVQSDRGSDATYLRIQALF